MSIASNFPAIKPTLLLDFANTEQLDSRITFTRASTATYYGMQTAKAEENLLLQSQDFTTSWSNTSSSDTANTSVAPDGTTTADTVTAAAGTAITPLVSQGALGSTSGLTYVFSVFAKAGTYSVLQLTNINFQASSAHANFDLSAGTVGTSANCTASIQNAGSGWYRCIIVFSATATVTNGAVYAVLSASTSANRFATWNPVGTETILLWGAQLEQRSAVTAYTPTTTQTITNYIPQLLTAASGVARFDHSPTTFESLGLEIEESRTNLVTYSEQFDNAAWAKTESTVVSNTIVAPDGAITGDKLVNSTTANESHFLTSTSVSFTSGTAYTLTCYAKAGERNGIRLQFSSGAFGASVAYRFDLTSGVATLISAGTGTSASATAVGNGWYRCSMTAQATITASRSVNIYIVDNSGATVYTGDGYSGIYIWGAQVEAGAFATSYIPTVASQVTRAADAASMTGTNFSSWYNQAEGTVYFEAQTAQGTNAYQYSLFGTSTQNRIFSNYASNNKNESGIRVNGVFEALVSSPNDSAPINTLGKGATAYKFNDFGFSWNGATALTDTSTTLPIILKLDIGNNNGAATNFLNGTIRKIAYYPIRVSNTNLQALTS